MKSNPQGVRSLRTFTVVRRESDSSSRTGLIGYLSGSEAPSPNMHCLIGLHGSWVWFNDFEPTDIDNQLFVSTGDASSLKEGDGVFYLLPSEFQPSIAFTLLDSRQEWKEQIFGSGLAASSKVLGTDGQSWTRIRPIDDPSELEDAESLIVDGWDHEHCTLCNKHIYPKAHYFLNVNDDYRFFLCVFCHDRFAINHVIEDVIYPTMGIRADEED